MDELRIDGSQGEGGGQILRTSLSLSMTTGRPFRIERIRAQREKPGLMRQHLAAVYAARDVCRAEVEGAELASGTLRFEPRAVRPGSYHFAVGTAGSACLVFQTVLPALLTAPEPSHLTFEGGTHNPHAPPFEFLERVFLPLLSRMGPRVTARLDRHGFVPAGGGRFGVDVASCKKLQPLQLLDTGAVRARSARSVICKLPAHIAERELTIVRECLGWSEEECRIEAVDAQSPGNVLLLEVTRDPTGELVAGFGERGVPAEKVAEVAVRRLLAYLEARVPVGVHLADQLLLPMALAGEGAFHTLPLSAHARTNVAVIEAFGIARFVIEERGRGVVINVRSA
ncbi:MAG: RNA 3'-terminal phosphate cyclase [Myxococcaceae bacterium]|nr:MAG: RNA 3'-terminal phosphate cyclase [Myxococcaceae bacterium]